MGKRKLILRNFLSPGDLVLLTAAVRDIHLGYPGRFLTDVRTSCPELWEHNPYLTPLRESDSGVELIDCHYPLIDRSNEAPYHCIHGFADYLGSRLKLPIRPRLFRGDIHLSADEMRWKSAVHELSGMDLPFWIINAGGKFDFTIKWWDWKRYQRVVDHFRGRILFVQVGDMGHYHPPLRHVVDLRGRTDLRQLVRLVHHAQGALCGVTALMHLAAAVPTRADRSTSRAAVIVAGGREPTHWEAYPHHQFIHTIGALPCCAVGGCWRARTRRIGDGEDSDRPENLCRDVVGELPRCMDMIETAEVTRRVEGYFTGGALRFLSAPEREAAQRAIMRSLQKPRFDSTINLHSAPAALERVARQARHAQAPPMAGRGILLLMVAAEDLTTTLAMVCVIQAQGSRLPIECWNVVPGDRRADRALKSLGVKVRYVAREISSVGPPLNLVELRAHALAHTLLREVLVLEPGNFPLECVDPWFGRREFRVTGALFPARPLIKTRPAMWMLCNLAPPRRSADCGVLLVDRHRVWPALRIWDWITQRLYFFHGYLGGQGGAAQLAFQQSGSRLPISQTLAGCIWSAEQGPAPPDFIRRAMASARRLLIH